MEFKNFKGQNYDALRKLHSSSNLFVDKIFPAENSSIWFSDEGNAKYASFDIEWKRPKEIVENPKFMVDGFDRIDVNQGIVGDCWFIAALAGICECPMILAKVIPLNQSLDEKDYCGMFYFRFWIYGDWYDVVIDDYLPYSEKLRSTIFCHNKKHKNEFWPSLLEKAYAKLYGSYESLEGGLIGSALVNLTGGIVENFFPKTVESELIDRFWSSLFLSYFKNSLMGCALEGELFEGQRSDGLQELHAYIITKLAVVMLRSGFEQKLVRIKNPHGLGSAEWKGDWSDSSSKWSEVLNLNEVDFVKEDEGEFWMSYEDFVKTWDRLYVCNLTPASFLSEIDKNSNLNRLKWKNLADVNQDDAWKSTVIHSAWSQSNSGGCDHTSYKYLNNPKLVFRIQNPENTKTSTILLSLTQKKDLLKTAIKQPAVEYTYCIRLDVYKLPAHYQINNYNQANLKEILETMVALETHFSDFINTSEVTLKLDLDDGLYLIVPCTDTENINLEFMLQVFSQEKINLSFLGEKNIVKEEIAEANVEPNIKTPVIPTVQELERVFSFLDIDKNGEITYDETCKAMRILNAKLGRSYNEDDINKFIKGLDENKDGKIKLDELKKNFINVMLHDANSSSKPLSSRSNLSHTASATNKTSNSCQLHSSKLNVRPASTASKKVTRTNEMCNLM